MKRALILLRSSHLYPLERELLQGLPTHAPSCLAFGPTLILSYLFACFGHEQPEQENRRKKEHYPLCAVPAAELEARGRQKV